MPRPNCRSALETGILFAVMDDGDTTSASGTVGSGDAQPGEPEALLRLRQIKSKVERAQERSQLVAPKLLGADEETARRVTTKEICELRIARRDRDRFPLTQDYRPTRITVEIEDGRVVSAEVG